MTHPTIAVTGPPAASSRRSKFVQRSNVWLCSREVLVGSLRRLPRLASDLRAVGAARGQGPDLPGRAAIAVTNTSREQSLRAVVAVPAGPCCLESGRSRGRPNQP
jgi:hypothetical protein